MTHPTLTTKPVEVSVVYYRAAYTPRDYQSPSDWATRLLIERSTAIKCPTVALQLAGAKKVQQVLAAPSNDDGLLQRFLPTEFHGSIKDIKASFKQIWPMDDSTDGVEAMRLAKEESDRFVLKPQREGGGNNIYKSAIPTALAEMDARDQERAGRHPNEEVVREREGYILMELIRPPVGVENVLVRAGDGKGVRTEIISELGIYGAALFRSSKGSKHVEMLVNTQAGHLLRTKGSTDDEGGVAVGFSVIDSPLLV